MTFLAPALLALGLAAAVPLALHLLQRHQGPRYLFPALRYLRRAERENARRVRLRQVLLLALRVLAIALLAGAAARPFLAAPGGEHAPTSVVIILDNSLASGAVVGERQVLDHLRDAALATVSRAGSEDRLWLIRAGRPWEPAVTGEPEVVAAAIRATEPSPGQAELGAELERAASILAAEPGSRATEIHLLSDLRTVVVGSPRVAGSPPVLVLDPPARPGANRAVTAVEVGGGLPPRAGAPSVVSARIDGFADTPVASPAEAPDSVDVRLVLEETVRAVVRTAIGDVATLPFPPWAAGLVTGRVEIEADALAADDRRHFVASIRLPTTVQVAEAQPFLDEALDVLAEAGRVRRGRPGPDGVVVAPGAAGADAVRRGAGVIVLPPSTPLELAAANQRLASAGLPWRLGAPDAGESRLDAAGTGLDRVLEDVRLRQVYRLEPVGEPGDSVLVRLTTGEPWAVAGTTASGRYVLVATPLTLDGGTLPTSAAMLPLLDRAINGWAAGAVERTDYRPGAVVTVPADGSVVHPGGATTPVSAGAPFRLTDAGIYRVVAGDTTVAAYAVNPAPAASDTRTLSAAEAARTLAGDDGRAVSAGAWARTVYQQRLGRDISALLLLAGLLVLLAEAALAAAGRGPRKRESEPVAAGPVAPNAAHSPYRSPF